KGDTRPKDDTKKPAPRPEEREPEALTEDDTTLLGLASAWHYVNGKRISGSLPAYAKHLDLIVRQASKPGAAGKLGRLVLTNYLIGLKYAEVSTKERELLQKKLPGEIFKLAARGALAGLKKEDIPPPFSDEFREGPAKSGQNWLDNLRRNEIGKWSVTVLSTQTNVNFANVFETDYAARMGRQRLGWDLLTVAPRKVDKHSYSIGNFLEVTYRGREALTDVVFVSRLKTTGGDSTLRASQLRIM